MGRGKSMKVYKRRLKVKELYLKGESLTEIASKFGVSVQTIENDIREINKQYMAAVEKNPHILERQAELILKHLDELQLVKKELWKLKETAKSDKDKLSALKAIIDELSHEARVQRLIDVTKTINNYIHIEKMGILVQQVTDIIKEFVPLEKQEYALRRIKAIGESIFSSDKKEERS